MKKLTSDYSREKNMTFYSPCNTAEKRNTRYYLNRLP